MFIDIVAEMETLLLFSCYYICSISLMCTDLINGLRDKIDLLFLSLLCIMQLSTNRDMTLSWLRLLWFTAQIFSVPSIDAGINQARPRKPNIVAYIWPNPPTSLARGHARNSTGPSYQENT